METTVVLGDVHARFNKCRTLLTRLGVIKQTTEGDVRQPGFKLVQVGDLVSLGYNEQEAPFLEWFTPLLEPQDEILMGNHEICAILGNNTLNFVGWNQRDIMAEKLIRDMDQQGHFQAATTVDKYLITHAGLHPAQFVELGVEEYPVEEIALALNEELQRRIETNTYSSPYDPILGTDPDFGGILWLRWDSLKHSYRNGGPCPQVVGHSPGAPGKHGDLWILDTPVTEAWHRSTALGKRPSREEWGGVCALVFEDGKDPEMVLEA